jgi:hypothetical protein
MWWNARGDQGSRRGTWRRAPNLLTSRHENGQRVASCLERSMRLYPAELLLNHILSSSAIQLCESPDSIRLFTEWPNESQRLNQATAQVR